MTLTDTWCILRTCSPLWRVCRAKIESRWSSNGALGRWWSLRPPRPPPRRGVSRTEDYRQSGYENHPLRSPSVLRFANSIQVSISRQHGRKLTWLCAVPWSSACVLRPESCPGTCRRSSPQDLPSFLYASKHCSSRSDHQLCFLVLEGPCSALLESLLSLLKSRSLLLKSLLLLLLLLNSSIVSVIRALTLIK